MKKARIETEGDSVEGKGGGGSAAGKKRKRPASKGTGAEAASGGEVVSLTAIISRKGGTGASSNWRSLAKEIGAGNAPPPSATPVKSEKGEGDEDEVEEAGINKKLAKIKERAKELLLVDQDEIPTTATSTRLTKKLAIDCEMVGVGEGGKESILAQVRALGWHG